MLIDFLKEAAAGFQDGNLGIYEARLLPSGEGYHLEVELDGLNDARGAVSIQDCSLFSRYLAEKLDQALESESSRAAFPADMDAENYSMEVASAGAERKLRIPVDLERFKELPMFVSYRVEGENSRDGVFEFFQEDQITEQVGDVIVFRTYQKKQKKRKHVKKFKPEKIELATSSIIEAKLYLDI